jgi:hypothetical protein
VLAAAAVLAAGCGQHNENVATVQTTPHSGSLTISALIYKTAAGQTCVADPNSTDYVAFIATAVSLDGGTGLESVDSFTLQMPAQSSLVGHDIENGSALYGCERQHRFDNLKLGTWNASVRGAVNGTCAQQQVKPGGNTGARISVRLDGGTHCGL